MRDIILYFAIKYYGDFEKIYDAIERQEDVDFEALEEEKKQIGNYTTILDDDYPSALKMSQKPPFVLFYKGNKELLKSEKVTWAFGSYLSEETEEAMIKQYEDSKLNGITIVSGYTNEFERKILNTIEPEGMIIVKDSGIDSYINMSRIEERMLIQNNLIVSEYPSKTLPSLSTFMRSGIVKAGISNSMFIINSLKERVTFQLISNAIDDKKKIYCYNGIKEDKSHNDILISKGAHSLDNINKIFQQN